MPQTIAFANVCKCIVCRPLQPPMIIQLFNSTGKKACGSIEVQLARSLQYTELLLTLAVQSLWRKRIIRRRMAALPKSTVSIQVNGAVTR